VLSLLLLLFLLLFLLLVRRVLFFCCMLSLVVLLFRFFLVPRVLVLLICMLLLLCRFLYCIVFCISFVSLNVFMFSRYSVASFFHWFGARFAFRHACSSMSSFVIFCSCSACGVITPLYGPNSTSIPCCFGFSLFSASSFFMCSMSSIISSVMSRSAISSSCIGGNLGSWNAAILVALIVVSISLYGGNTYPIDPRSRLFFVSVMNNPFE